MNTTWVWQWLGDNASELAAIVALASIVAFVAKNLVQLYSSFSLTELLGKGGATILRTVGYVSDRLIWIFVGVIIAVSTNAFTFLATPHT